jgi:MFS superfamily sulfate permease-like transporter/CRP-like cAMP-binding protein
MQIPRGENLRNDIIGGLVSAGVAIPLAMGYGMFAFIALGNEYFPDGALAGLVTAVIVGIVCVVLGDKSSNLYAPRVTTTFFIGILLYNLAHADVPIIKSGGLGVIIPVIFSIILLAGVFQALFGLARLGTLIKHTPQPVMAGFQNAAALILILVQLANIFGFDKSTSFVQALKDVLHAKPLSVAIAIAAVAAMWNSKKFLPKVPPIAVGLAVGTVLYYAFGLAGFGLYLGPTIGSGPFNSYKLPNFPQFGDLARTAGVVSLLPTIVGGALALAIIAAIDALLCAKILARPGEPKVDGDRLLMRLGAANVLAAGAGGITGGLNIGPSRDNRAFGGRSPLSALVNAAVLLVTLVALFPALSFLPCVAISAVILVIAVQHVDPWSLRLARRVASASPSHRWKVLLDLLVVLLVAVLSVAIDIVVAVFVGVAIAALLFMVRMSRSIIRRQYRGTSVRSRKFRPLPDMDALTRSASSILVMELQGALFFGSAEKVAGEIAVQTQQDTRYVVLDLRRVSEIDSTGSEVLQEINSDLASRDKHLLLSFPLASLPAELLADSSVVIALTRSRIFPDLDRAIAWAEDDLLRGEAHPSDEPAELALDQVGILAGFTPAEIAELEKHVTRAVYEPGRVIFGEGDPGNELFIIAKGTATASLRQAGGGDIRLVSFAPGTVFGELAMLDAGTRSATVSTEEELVCYVLAGKEFAALSERKPAVAIKLLSNLARRMSLRLRDANRTIQQLED